MPHCLVYSNHWLSPLFSALASSGRLCSLCSDWQGLNATAEMIIPPCSYSGFFFVFLSSPLTPPPSLFFLSVSALPIFFIYVVLTVRYSHARGMLKPYSRLREHGDREKKTRDSVKNRKNRRISLTLYFKKIQMPNATI